MNKKNKPNKAGVLGFIAGKTIRNCVNAVYNSIDAVKESGKSLKSGFSTGISKDNKEVKENSNVAHNNNTAQDCVD